MRCIADLLLRALHCGCYCGGGEVLHSHDLEESWDAIAMVIYARKKKGESCDTKHGTSVCCGKEKIQWAEPVVIVSRASLILSTRAIL